MKEAKLWRPRWQSVEQVHAWRPRRSRYGELVQWDSSEHDWLEGRGEPMKLILMIDDATSKWFAAGERESDTISEKPRYSRREPSNRFGESSAPS